MRTLVDCGCETKVHADGSGVEIYFCSLHEAAPKLLKSLQALLDVTPFATDMQDAKIRCDAREAVLEARGY